MPVQSKCINLGVLTESTKKNIAVDFAGILELQHDVNRNWPAARADSDVAKTPLFCNETVLNSNIDVMSLELSERQEESSKR